MLGFPFKMSTNHASNRTSAVLMGPPGLLFGLTLVVFLAARLTCGKEARHDTVEVNASADPSGAVEVARMPGGPLQEQRADGRRQVGRGELESNRAEGALAPYWTD